METSQKQPVVNFTISLLQNVEQKKNSIEGLFTELSVKNAWGAKTTVSGPTSTLEKTTELRSSLLSVLKQLEIKSILDCGCGDFHWMKEVNLLTIHYLGVDIVESLIKYNQLNYTTESVHFQKMNLLVDPPETTDVWFARDFCCLYSYKEIKLFFKKFIESNTPYLAITSIDSSQENTDGVTGSWRPLNILAPPFNLHNPSAICSDGYQWFRKKTIHFYSREQIQSSFFLSMNFEDIDQSSAEIVPVSQETNAHLVNNIRLKDVKLPGFGNKTS
jgi:hypothetical protein